METSVFPTTVFGKNLPMNTTAPATYTRAATAAMTPSTMPNTLSGVRLRGSFPKPAWFTGSAGSTAAPCAGTAPAGAGAEAGLPEAAAGFAPAAASDAGFFLPRFGMTMVFPGTAGWGADGAGAAPCGPPASRALAAPCGPPAPRAVSACSRPCGFVFPFASARPPAASLRRAAAEAFARSCSARAACRPCFAFFIFPVSLVLVIAWLARGCFHGIIVARRGAPARKNKLTSSARPANPQICHAAFTSF